MKKVKYNKVFTPGTFPELTYYTRENSKFESKVRDALEIDGMLISISGPSKSGKTVLVEKIVGKENLISITGSGIRSAEDLWRKVLAWMGEPDEKAEQSQNVSQGKIMTSAKGKVGVFLAEGEFGGSIEGSYQTGKSISKSSKIPKLQTIIDEIGNSDFVILIDDFHYIEKNSQKEIAQELKEAIRNKIKIITASIPFHTDDAIRANTDLRGRVITLDLEYWKQEELIEISKKGEVHLNLKFENRVLERISADASGSPQLMQQIMACLCQELQIKETLDQIKNINLTEEQYQLVMERASLSADYSTLEKILEGPKTRGSERKHYKFKNGKIGDVYRAIFEALALDPPLLTVKYSKLLERIQEVCESESPSGSSVSGSCGHIQAISEELANDILIEWDSEREVLNIKDPYILFYLRWSNLLK